MSLGFSMPAMHQVAITTPTLMRNYGDILGDDKKILPFSWFTVLHPISKRRETAMPMRYVPLTITYTATKKKPARFVEKELPQEQQIHNDKIDLYDDLIKKH